MTPPFSESQKLVTLPLFPPSLHRLISDKSLMLQNVSETIKRKAIEPLTISLFWKRVNQTAYY